MKALHSNVVLAFILLLLLPSLAFSQNGENVSDVALDDLFTIEISKVVINQDTLSYDSISSIRSAPQLILSTNDTISVFYRLLQNAEGEFPANINFLYKVSLSNEDGDESLRSLNMSSVSYLNLPESEYIFSVSAFDIKKTWATSQATISIRVDDGEVALLDSIARIQEQNKKDIELAENNTDYTDKRSVIPFVAGIIFTVLISGLLYILVSNRNSKNKKTSLKNQDIYKSEPFIALQRERDRFKQELEALRGQISGMESRSEQIRATNRELEEKVSKLTEYKDNLEQLQEQKDDLFAVIIHDIKNPVGIIKNLVELLRSFDLTATEQQEIMDDIVKTTQTIVSLSHEVSRVLALEGGRTTMNYTVQNISPLVEEVVDRNKSKAVKKSIEISFIDEEVNSFSYDAMKIYEVADNLISNAVKFTQSGGAVRVRTYQKDGNAVIEIADNGLGLSEEDLHKAFKKGSQLSARPTGGESSTGLGLWIVKKLVEAHDGRVAVKSVLGQGSTFSVFLPQTTENKQVTVEM